MKNHYFILLFLVIIILLYLINKKSKYERFGSHSNYRNTKIYKVSNFFQNLINNFTYGKEITDSSRYTRVQF